MDLSIDAKVTCLDGECGTISAVVLNPVTAVVTNIVVRQNEAPHTKRLVPISEIRETTQTRVQLGLTLEAFRKCKEFVEMEYIITEIPRYQSLYGVYYLEPLALPESKVVTVPHLQIPAGELPVERGSKVFDFIGEKIGQVDEFLIDEDSGHITHLILREGHLWGKKEVSIPVSEIKKVEEDRVYLKLDKEAVGKLPGIPAVRKWL